MSDGTLNNQPGFGTGLNIGVIFKIGDNERRRSSTLSRAREFYQFDDNSTTMYAVAFLC
jgi:hypothetical protein